MKTYLPITIDITGKKILIIGGGEVAKQKIRTLQTFTRNLTVLAPEILPEVRALGVTCLTEKYSPKKLRGFFLVYACTNNRALNRQIRNAANKARILVNVVDDPALCDFISPAIYKKAEMSVAVSSNGQNCQKSIRWRNKLKEYLTHGAARN